MNPLALLATFSGCTGLGLEENEADKAAFDTSDAYQEPEDTGADSAEADTAPNDSAAPDDTGGDTSQPAETGDSGPAGTSTANISGSYNGQSFVLSFDSGGDSEVSCDAEGGYYYFRVRDLTNVMQLTVYMAQPVAGTTVASPSLGVNSMSLGPVTDWALDTTFHGKLNHAVLSFDEFDAGVRVSGSIDVAWDYDGATALPAADAAGNFEVFCP